MYIAAQLLNRRTVFRSPKFYDENQEVTAGKTQVGFIQKPIKRTLHLYFELDPYLIDHPGNDNNEQ